MDPSPWTGTHAVTMLLPALAVYLVGPRLGLLFTLFLGWPGLLLGAALGALAWKRRRIYGAVLGAALGLGACVGLQFLWQ